MLYDLEAEGVCTVEEALRSTLPRNLQRSYALARRRARYQLGNVSALTQSIGAAFDEKASKQLARTLDVLNTLSGAKSAKDTPTEDRNG